MRLIDSINPWGASNLKAEIKRLEKIIAEGHYRNPKTGRLGRKGEVFTK